MTKKSKTNIVNPSRMTKVQLKEVLDDARDRLQKREEEHQQVQKKLKDKNILVKEMHQELGELKRKHLGASKEQQTLINDLQESEKEARSRIKELEKEIKESNQNKRALERKNKSLKEKNDELEKTLAAQGKVEVDFTESISAARTAFRIDFYERQDHYRGKIIHLLSKDEKTFQGIDETVISEFILRHIPEVADEKEKVPAPIPSEELVEAEKFSEEELGAISAPQTEVVEHLIENIQLLQNKRIIETGRSVSAHLPFSLQAQFHLPITPTQENMDVDTNTYGIRLIAMDEAEKNVFASNGTADMLSAGVESYESEIGMPGLEPGKYRLKLYAFAPFAQIEDSRDIELNVIP